MAERKRILVVEDDAPIRRGIADALRFSGYDAVEAADGAAGLQAALTAEIDLVLLDVLMPKKDGFAVLKEVRAARPSMPVIMLTAKGEEADRVRGLREGSDDYVVKPFSATELLARVDAVLRRSPERPQQTESIQIAGRTIDLNRREVLFTDGTRATLSEREAQTLGHLIRNRGRAISRDELLRAVWGLDPRGVQTRTVDMTVARLRELLRDGPLSPRVIVTLRSKGYMLADGCGADTANYEGGEP
jgi:two-component system, OmpR family, alkaline phosphatase synthesis response regulator PhoP